MNIFLHQQPPYAVMGPDLYNKWAPRTVSVLYTEGLTKRATPTPMIMTAMSLPMPIAEFETKKAGFKKALADSAGVSSDRVSLDKISGATRIDISIHATDDAAASKICSGLVPETINIKLAVLGLPKADLVEKPHMCHPGYTVLDFLTNTAGLPLNVASALCPQFLENNFTTRHKIFAMTDDDLKACGVSREKQRQQILLWIAQGDDLKRQVSSEETRDPVPTYEAYVNMKKAVQQIKAREVRGAENETLKYARLRHLNEGDIPGFLQESHRLNLLFLLHI